jgi:peptidoglycan/xylan/chitin deacetylase (PgdA/CDA1 family)
MRETVAAGHTVGIHAWDHVGWHDRLPEMNREEIEDVVAKEHARFREVFGFPATYSAAPGWTATPLSVEVQEAHGVTATSDTRGGRPFFPVRADGSVSKVFEIPSTLPTLDELLALPLPGDGPAVERACELLRMRMRNPDAPPSAFSFEVHSIHTEIEGGPAFSAPFARLLAAWKGEGVAFLTFEEILKSLRPDRSPAGGAREQSGFPVRRLSFTTLPGRATPVATGWAGG